MKEKILPFLLAIALSAGILFALQGCSVSGIEQADINRQDKMGQADGKAGTSKNGDKNDVKMLRMVLVTPIVNHPIFSRIKEGFDRAGKEYGFETYMTGSDDTSIDKMIEAIEIAIAERVDGIVTYPMSPSAFTPVFEKAKKAGIKVGCIFADAEKKDLRVSFVGTDSKLCGRDQAEAIYKKIKAPLKVGVVVSALDAQDELSQVEGATEFLKTIPGSEIVAMVKNDGDMLKSAEELQSMLKAHPQINCVIGTDGASAPGFGKALEELKLVDRITVIAMDDVDQNLQTVKSGLIYGIMAQGFDSMGYLNGKNIAAAIRGEKYEDVTLIPAKLVNKENIDSYMKPTK